MSIHTTIASQYKQNPQFELATLAGGCFWCVEAAFDVVKGVIDVESGYAGSDYTPANYEAVCTGQTGLAEVVHILFDPSVITFEQILTIFFVIHNPTTLNRQGADTGTQYRSAIFTHSTQQAITAKAMLPIIEANWGEPVVTQIEPIHHYTRAEDYHQEYFVQHPNQGYCQAVIPPKLAKLRSSYASLLK